ncbi:MAG: DUF1461 domain-containing protein [Raoultibacter sp.]
MTIEKPPYPEHGIIRETFVVLAQPLCAICLAFCLIGAGIFVCCAPQTTRTLAEDFSGNESTTFSKETMIELAVAGRDYTVDGTSLDKFYTLIFEDAINNAKADIQKWLPKEIDISNIDISGLAKFFGETSDVVGLPTDAVTHLDDVRGVINNGKLAIVLAAVVALFTSIIVYLTRGRRRIGLILLGAAGAVCVAFACVGLWVLVDFNGFFAFFHSLFFAEGTWTFSADSLLINMYPPDFWIGMGAAWLITSVLSCAAAGLVGFLLKGRKGRHLL